MKLNQFRYRHAYSLTFLKATLASIGVGLTLIYAGITEGGLYFTSNGWPTGMCLTVIFLLALRDLFKLPGGLLTHSKRITLYEKGFSCSDRKSQDAGRRFLIEQNEVQENNCDIAADIGQASTGVEILLQMSDKTCTCLANTLTRAEEYIQ